MITGRFPVTLRRNIKSSKSTIFFRGSYESNAKINKISFFYAARRKGGGGGTNEEWVVEMKRGRGNGEDEGEMERGEEKMGKGRETIEMEKARWDGGGREMERS